jgi:hypothetical protein
MQAAPMGARARGGAVSYHNRKPGRCICGSWNATEPQLQLLRRLLARTGDGFCLWIRDLLDPREWEFTPCKCEANEWIKEMLG